MARRSKPPEQLYIDGTEPPRNKAVEERIDAWNRAKADAKDAAESVRLRHASMVMEMANQGLEFYDYVDATTGKRKRVKIKRDPKAVTGAAPREAKQKRKRGQREEDATADASQQPAISAAGNGTPPTPPADHSDPFGKIRREMEATPS